MLAACVACIQIVVLNNYCFVDMVNIVFVVEWQDPICLFACRRVNAVYICVIYIFGCL